MNGGKKYTELLNVEKRLFRDKRRKRRKSSKIFFSQFTNEKDKENRDMFEIILMNEYC